MKKHAILSVLVIILVLVSCKEKAKNENSIVEKLTNKIEVLDFHSTHRCMTCNAIETNTRFTLETYFSKQLKNKDITFKAVNVDEEENFKLAEKFEATGTALFLNVIVDGKETKIDLTNFAFMNGNDKEVFSNELKTKILLELEKI
jgi:thiol-disulfide isomerase/thioredoxin